MKKKMVPLSAVSCPKGGMSWRGKESVPHKGPVWAEPVLAGPFAAHLAGPPRLIWSATQENIVFLWGKDHVAEQLFRFISCQRQKD